MLENSSLTDELLSPEELELTVEALTNTKSTKAAARSPSLGRQVGAALVGHGSHDGGGQAGGHGGGQSGTQHLAHWHIASPLFEAVLSLTPRPISEQSGLQSLLQATGSNPG